MFTVFLFYKEKRLLTGEGCVGVVIPWQFCRTIGPLTLHSQEIVDCPRFKEQNQQKNSHLDLDTVVSKGSVMLAEFCLEKSKPF